MTAVHLTDLWDNRQRGVVVRLVTLPLFLLSLLYGLIVSVRVWLYQAGLFKVRRLPKPVVSVGNITVGGTGKTPVTAYIAALLLERGLRVVVLSRGYGGSLEGNAVVVSDGVTIFETPTTCGDEPYLLASSVPGLPVVIGADRYQAGLLAVERLAPDIFLLDDGFQHVRLHRDLNILLMDCVRPFGNGNILPAGPLREPQKAVSRADLLIYTRCTSESDSTVKICPDLPVCRAEYRLSSFYQLDSGKDIPIEIIKTQHVLAVAGIAYPASFYTSLKAVGITPCSTLSLPDHEPYSAVTLNKIKQLAKEYAVTLIITTEKDAVKLGSLPGLQELTPIVVAKLELAFDKADVLQQELEKIEKI